MRINVSFDIDERDCNPQKLLNNFPGYLDEILEIGIDDEDDFPFVIIGIDLHSFMHEVAS